MTNGATDLAAKLESGFRHHMAGQLEEARACYEDVLRHAPRHGRTLALAGALALQSGDARRAADRLEAAVEVNPGDAGSWNNLGAACVELQRLDEAESAYRRSLDIDARQADTWNNLATLLRMRGATDEAVEAFRETLALAPGDWGCRRALAALLTEIGDPWQGARELTRVVELVGDDPEIWAELARALTRIDDPKGAEQAWRRVLALRPDDAPALVGLAAALRSQERYDAAAASLDEAIRARPTEPRLWLSRGNVMLSAGEPEKAAEAFERALELDSSQFSGRLNLGVSRLKTGRPEEAAAMFAALRSDYPSLAKISYYQGLAALEGGELEAAVAYFDEALGQDPLHINSLWYRGHCLRELGRDDEVRDLLHPDAAVRASRPLEATTAEDRRAFLDQLTTYVVEYPLFRWEPAGSTTRGGFQTPSLPPHEAPIMRSFRDMVAREVDRFLESLPQDHVVRRHWPGNWTLSVWGTILHSGGHQRPHIHPGGVLSGVFYTELPPTSPENPHAGWIRFGEPAYEMPASYEHWTRLVEPEPGSLVIFPSYMPHSTVPFDSDRRRVSVAFDVMPGGRD